MKETKKILKRILFVLLFVVLLPLVLIEVVIGQCKRAIARKKWREQELDGHKVLLSSNITDIDLMDGYMFEGYLKILLFYLGYKVMATGKSHDYGADLLIKADDGSVIAIQAKRYNKHVSAKAVQEVLACKKHYNANEAWVITNNTFTSEAEQIAKENQVRLIDRQELIEMYTSAREKLNVDAADGQFVYNKADLNNKYPYYI